MGQCDVCKDWNCVVEEITESKSCTDNIYVPDNFFETIPDTGKTKPDATRHETAMKEINRVLGGGFVDGSVILLGGNPGIGKSTLLMQLLSQIQGIDHYIYISAEESTKQVSMRAQRLKVTNYDVRIASS